MAAVVFIDEDAAPWVARGYTMVHPDAALHGVGRAVLRAMATMVHKPAAADGFDAGVSAAIATAAGNFDAGIAGAPHVVQYILSWLADLFQQHMGANVWVHACVDHLAAACATPTARIVVPIAAAVGYRVRDVPMLIDLLAAKGVAASTAGFGVLGPAPAPASASAPGVGAKAVVLVEGRKGAGKSTVGDMLVGSHGYEEVSLAGPLRSIAVAVFNVSMQALGARLRTPLTRALCIDQATKERPLHELVAEPGAPPLMLAGQHATPRWLLQWLGTNVCRTVMGDDVWLRAAAASDASHIVITDVRFMNEATTLKALFEARGYCVVRLKVVNPTDAPLGPDAHASERDIDALPCDVRVVNDKARGKAAFLASVAAALA